MDPTLTGICIMAVNMVFFPISIITGLAMTRRGKFLWAIWTGWTMLILGNGLLLLLDQDVSIVTSVLIFLVSGIGQGLLITSINVAIQSIAASKDVGYALSMYAFMRTFGMCLGVAIGGTIFQNFMLRQLNERDLPLDVALHAERFVAEVTAMPVGPLKTALRDAYTGAFHGVFYTLLILAALCGVLSFFIKHHDMDKNLDSEHILRGKVGLGAVSRKGTDESV